MNQIRASYYFQQTLIKSLGSIPKPKCKFHFRHWLVYVLIRIAGPFYNRTVYSRLYKFKKHLWVFENYKMEKLESLYKKYIPFFGEFYKDKRIEEKYTDTTLFNELLR